MQTTRPFPLIRYVEPQAFSKIASLQRTLAEDRCLDRIPDLALLLEHRPVIALGRRAQDKHLLIARDKVQQMGIDMEIADRGGDITWHGPGQFVLYLLLRLSPGGASLGHLARLETIAVETAQSFGVQAFRREGRAGAWTPQGKLAAIGFRIRRGVTYYGLSFNVAPDLRGFDLIVPCGLVGETVTSLAHLLGDECPSMDQVAGVIASVCGLVLHREICTYCPDSVQLPSTLRRRLTQTPPGKQRRPQHPD